MCDNSDEPPNIDGSSYAELLSLLNKISLYVEMTEKRQILDNIDGSSCDPKTLVNVDLRDYQRKGYKWILGLYENGMNGILADEMGLGKTVQVIAALASLIEVGVHGPYLIVAPLSLLSVWADQLAMYAPRLPRLVYYGTMLDRLKLRSKIRKRTRIDLARPMEPVSIHTSKTCPPKNPLMIPPIGNLISENSSTNATPTASTLSVCSFPSTSSRDTDMNEEHQNTLKIDMNSLASQTFDGTLPSSSNGDDYLDQSTIESSFVSVSNIIQPQGVETPLRQSTDSTANDGLEISQKEILNTATVQLNNLESETSMLVDSGETGSLLPSSSMKNLDTPFHSHDGNQAMCSTEEIDVYQGQNLQASGGIRVPPVSQFLSEVLPGSNETQTTDDLINTPAVLSSKNPFHDPEAVNEEIDISRVPFVEPASSSSNVCSVLNSENHFPQTCDTLGEQRNEYLATDVPPITIARPTSSAIALTHFDEVISDVISRWEPKEKPNEDLVTDVTPTIGCPISSELALAHLDEVISEVITRWEPKGKRNATIRNATRPYIRTEQKKRASAVQPPSASESTENVFWAYPIVLTSYEVAMRDSRYLQRVPFKGLIVDEGQRLKNPESQLYKRLAKFSTGLRLLITGTPLQNRLSELWALLHFILPEIFSSLEMFEHWFDPVVLSGREGRDRLINAETERSLITKLHYIIRPFVLRRTKEETDLLLPPKREILLRVGMSELQKKLYQQALRMCLKSHTELSHSKRSKLCSSKGGSSSWLDNSNILNTDPVDTGDHGHGSQRLTRQSRRSASKPLVTPTVRTRSRAILDLDSPMKNMSDPPFDFILSPSLSLNNGIMLLRRIANHPYLAIDRSDNAEELVTEQMDASGAWNEHLTPNQMTFIEASEKTRLLDRLLKKLIETKHKVLIFSQLTMVLDILEDLLVARGWSFVRLDGSTNLSDRQKCVSRFNHEPVEELPIFLVSTRAGGCGLNLQAAANTVILFDSDWNPQTDLQAQDRCHRIGQTHPVLVIRIITAGTVDETILNRAQTKRGLERLIMVCGTSSTRSGAHLFSKKTEISKIPNKRGWLSDQADDSGSGTRHGMSKSELLQLLLQTDYDKEASNVDNFSDDALDKLLDRTDMYKSWKEKIAASIHPTSQVSDSTPFIGPIEEVQNESHAEPVEITSNIVAHDKLCFSENLGDAPGVEYHWTPEA